MNKIDPNSLVDPKFIGIPYVLSGKTFEGSDCIGACLLWLKDQGVEYEYDDGMGPIMNHWWEHNPKRFINAFLMAGNIVRFSQLKKYDCVLLLGAEISTFPSCVGVMVDDRHFLMSIPGRGSFVQMMNQFWKLKTVSSIRLHKVIERYGL